ncbi:transcriptional regulator of aroF, aroG, tyrA and aromatic amino acid transport [Oceanospirillum multiglobuliferum]|uniref:HTH-type transcriptional regulatory protein TyrR n=1 Tax=Oceanospirillum multiglobuliferum TaxID=64969 RepID=A0A1T4QU26_9GAMM|nr:sigma-54-dependent transcriptional regulator [Oceanospirillum multiglobuliferum]OPX57124.1 AAA family ATPase [Oceanospirillum multiglobuliferum]SKA07156.1 transcriptional regulator of aroF, aroG, tyrA and aromatic amino acid transport [Oceanospirillum multiglobuliferum]
MRLEIICQNRVGIMRDILEVFVEFRINVVRAEAGGDKCSAIYLYMPGMLNIQLQSVRSRLEKIAGVYKVRRINLIPSERRHFELDILLQSLDIPVLSVDSDGRVVVANIAAGRVLGVRVDEVPGMSLGKRIKNLDLETLLPKLESRLNGVRTEIRGDAFLADISPIYFEDKLTGKEPAGAVICLHPVESLGAKLYSIHRHDAYGFDALQIQAPKMLNLIREAKRMAPLNAPLLIQGETGTGKEMLARACHQSSPRGRAPFMVLNCAALPDNLAESELFGYASCAFEGARVEGKLGLLDITSGGTIFLDEVGEMSPHLQVKLLRFLQDGCFRRVGSDDEIQVDVRVICATQKDLSELCEQGVFREDLFHRLNVLALTIPPLRNCKEGIISLAAHFIDRACQQIGAELPKLSEGAQQLLKTYHWPGNVRQLENVLYQAVSICEGREIKADHIRLPALHQGLNSEVDLTGNWGNIIDRVEIQVLSALYPDYPSSRLLAKRLGVSHTTIANKLRKYDIGQS